MEPVSQTHPEIPGPPTDASRGWGSRGHPRGTRTPELRGRKRAEPLDASWHEKRKKKHTRQETLLANAAESHPFRRYPLRGSSDPKRPVLKGGFAKCWMRRLEARSKSVLCDGELGYKLGKRRGLMTRNKDHPAPKELTRREEQDWLGETLPGFHHQQPQPGTDASAPTSLQPGFSHRGAQHGELEPWFRGACAPTFSADLYLFKCRGLLRPGWSQSGVISGVTPVCRHLLQSGCCRISLEIHDSHAGALGSGAAAAADISPSLLGTPAMLSRINVSRYRLGTVKITLITHAEPMPRQG